MVRVAEVVAALLLLLAQTSMAGAAEPVVRVLKAHFTQKQQQTERYVYVPFEVPAGVTRIDIDFKYPKAEENVVDLGLMEPGSTALHTKAFRGWSGGERNSIFVSSSDATPGYWPGPIQVGTWRVALGLYKVGLAGVDVEIAVKTSNDSIPPLPPALPVRPKEPIRTGPAWYSGGLHAHSHNSDGALSIQALAAKARGEGLDFLALSDHNTTAQQREAIDVPGLLIIISEEVTTPGGHANVWGLGGKRDLVDFRVLPGDPAINHLFDAAVAKGALVGVNHPYGSCVACSWTHGIPAQARTIEITSREPDEMRRAIAMWDVLLRKGRHLAAVGVSDWHRGDTPIGQPSVRVFAPELSTKAILNGLRAGRVVVMMDATTAPPYVHLTSGAKEAKIGDTLDAVPGDGYTYSVSVEGKLYEGASVELYWNGERVALMPLVSGKARFERFVSTSGYLRAHMVSAAGAPLAIINPIWIKTAAR